jgi:predicted nucleic acid-binding protein
LRFLLDTNAFSEIVRTSRDQGLADWLATVEEDDLFISVLTIGEVTRGVLLLPQGERRRQIRDATDHLIADYGERVLDLDEGVARQWGELSARYKSAGIVVGVADELIAATALRHDLVMVTRNTRHFEHGGCKLLSPWTS